MSCGSGLSPSSLLAGAGMAGGLGGMVSAMGPVASLAGGGAVLTQASNALSVVAAATPGGIPADPLTGLTGSVLPAVIAAGNSSGIASALTGQVPTFAQSVLGETDMLGSLVSQATTYLPADISSGVQIFNQALSYSGLSQDIMQTASKAFGTEFGAITDLAKDFTNGGFLGEGIGDFNEMLTNGIAGLTDGLSSSITDLGANFSDFGSFGDFADLGNLMNPGQIVNQMLNQDLGDIGNLANSLLENGIPLDDLLNPIYQFKIQDVMNGITDAVDLSDIQGVMGSSLNINALGELTDFSKMIDTNIASTFNSFSELGTNIADLGTGTIESIGQYGEMIGNIASGDDLPNLLNKTTLMDQASFDLIANSLGNGTGPAGSVVLSDIFGTAGAYGHDVYLSAYKDATDALETSGVTSLASTLYSELSAGIGGSYTVGSNITDPRTSIVYTTLDDFAVAKTAQITSEFSALDSNNDPYLSSASSTWSSSAQAAVTENTVIGQSDIDPSNVTAGHTTSMWSFAGQLNELGKDEFNSGQHIERVSSNNVTGEAMKHALREGRNRNLYSEYGMEYAGNIKNTKESSSKYTDPIV